MPDPIVLTPEQMLEPVNEQAVLYLCAFLRQITVDNGYPVNVAVDRLDPEGNPRGVENADYFVVVEEGFPEEAFDVTPGPLDGYRMRVNCYCSARNNRKLTNRDWATVLNRVAATVRQHLQTDIHLGDYASLGVNFATPTGAQVYGLPAFNQPIDFVYWTKRNDPFTAYKDIES